MIKLKKRIYILCFIIPVAVMLCAYYAGGIFGDYTILLNDLNSQYVTFLSYLRKSVFQNGIFYSFSKGLGGNFFGVFSYYLASPLNLLIFLFSPQNIEAAVAVIMLLRFGLYAVSFAWYLSNKNVGNIAIVVFSSLYALTSFNVVLSYHILWADAFILLPIIVLGQQDILKGKNSKLFIISFTALLIINYYMAYMVGIFCVLIYICFVITIKDKQRWITAFVDMAKAAGVSILLASWSLIPTVFSLLQGKISINGPMQDSGKFIFNISAIIPKLFVGEYAGVGNVSAPFIYFGAASLPLVIGYFFLQNKTKRQKLSALFILAFLAAGLIYSPLYKMWHMFALTNAFPYRFIYIIAFVVLTLAVETFCNAKQLDFKKYLPTVTAFIIAVLGLGIWYPIHIRNLKIAFTTGVALAVLALAYLSKNKKNIMYFAAILMLADISLNAAILVKTTYQDLDPLQINAYKDEYLLVQKHLEKIKEDDDFFRISYIADPSGARPSIVNHSFKHGYNGFYYCFTSLPEIESEQMLYALLYPADLQVRNAIAGVKYLLSYDEIIKNEAYFPMIYTAIGQVGDMADIKQENKLVYYIKTVTGVDILEKNGTVNGQKLAKATELAQKNSAVEIYKKGNKIKAKVTALQENMQVYTSIIFDEGWRIKVNGQGVETKRVLDNFIAFDVPKGDCKIEMTYYPKGLITGVLVSAFTILTLLWYLWLKKIKIKTIKQKR